MEKQDPILAALNGADPVMPPMIDPAPPAAPTREAQLTIPVISSVTDPVQSADALHATKHGGRGYKIRVKGEYYAQNPDGRGKIKKPYAAEFNVAQLDGALSVIKNKLIKFALTKKYPDFAAERTCYVMEAIPLNAATPKSNNLAYMDREQLIQYIAQSNPKIPIDLSSPDSYLDVTQLREAVIDYVQTPDGFAARERVRQEKRAEDRELAILNPDLAIGA